MDPDPHYKCGSGSLNTGSYPDLPSSRRLDTNYWQHTVCFERLDEEQDLHKMIAYPKRRKQLPELNRYRYIQQAWKTSTNRAELS
jgi:hypothetical protein